MQNLWEPCPWRTRKRLCFPVVLLLKANSRLYSASQSSLIRDIARHSVIIDIESLVIVRLEDLHSAYWYGLCGPSNAAFRHRCTDILFLAWRKIANSLPSMCIIDSGVRREQIMYKMLVSFPTIFPSTLKIKSFTSFSLYLQFLCGAPITTVRHDTLPALKISSCACPFKNHAWSMPCREPGIALILSAFSGEKIGIPWKSCRGVIMRLKYLGAT